MPAHELSYFQGLSAITPNSAEVACHSACLVIGGWAMPFPAGTLVSLATTSQEMHLTPIGTGGPPARWALDDVAGIRFGGPGARTHGGGYWGGGFGLVGAAEGILAAKLLNKVTTKTTINSEIHIDLVAGGMILHSARLTPEQLRLRFSAAAGRVGARARSAPQPRQTPGPVAGDTAELERLAALHRSGALTADEFSRAKARILGL